MQPFTVLTAVAVPLEFPNIDTGMILPGRYMRRHRRPGQDYGEAFLYDLRFDEAGKPRADFVLNDPRLPERENTRNRSRFRLRLFA